MIPIGLVCLVVSGCGENTPPSLDLPSDADMFSPASTVDGGGAAIDEGIVDVGLVPDQAFIPSSNPIPTRIETTLNVAEIFAGQQAQVQCTVPGVWHDIV